MTQFVNDFKETYPNEKIHEIRKWGISNKKYADEKEKIILEGLNLPSTQELKISLQSSREP